MQPYGATQQCGCFDFCYVQIGRCMGYSQHSDNVSIKLALVVYLLQLCYHDQMHLHVSARHLGSVAMLCFSIMLQPLICRLHAELLERIAVLSVLCTNTTLQPLLCRCVLSCWTGVQICLNGSMMLHWGAMCCMLMHQWRHLPMLCLGCSTRPQAYFCWQTLQTELRTTGKSFVKRNELLCNTSFTAATFICVMTFCAW